MSRSPRAIPASWWSIRASRPRRSRSTSTIAKAEPGKLAYATSGAGSSNHLLGARLEQVIGAALVHVPYRGAGPAMVDTIAGNVPSMFNSLPSAAPHIKAGKVRALAVSGEERNPAFPDVPTMKESGYPDLISYSWFGISVPARTPQPIVDRLATEMQAVLKEPAVVKRWEEIGAESEHHDAGRGHALHPGRDRQVGAGGESFRRQARITNEETSMSIRRVTSPHVPEPPPERWSNCLVSDGIAYVSGMTARGTDPASSPRWTSTSRPS